MSLKDLKVGEKISLKAAGYSISDSKKKIKTLEDQLKSAELKLKDHKENILGLKDSIKSLKDQISEKFGSKKEMEKKPDNWFDKMGKEKQKQYLKDHPDSGYNS